MNRPKAHALSCGSCGWGVWVVLSIKHHPPFPPRTVRVRAFLLAEGLCAFRPRLFCPLSVLPRAVARSPCGAMDVSRYARHTHAPQRVGDRLATRTPAASQRAIVACLGLKAAGKGAFC